MGLTIRTTVPCIASVSSLLIERKFEPWEALECMNEMVAEVHVPLVFPVFRNSRLQNLILRVLPYLCIGEILVDG